MENKIVKQDYEIITTVQNFNLLEQKIFCNIFTALRFIENPNQNIKISFDCKNLNSSNTEIKKAINNIVDNPIFKTTQLATYYFFENNKIQMAINNDLKEHLINISKNYTDYELTEIFKLKRINKKEQFKASGQAKENLIKIPKECLEKTFEFMNLHYFLIPPELNENNSKKASGQTKENSTKSTKEHLKKNKLLLYKYDLIGNTKISQEIKLNKKNQLFLIITVYSMDTKQYNQTRTIIGDYQEKFINQCIMQGYTKNNE